MTADSIPIKWPNGAKCAVCITLDFDAESLWLNQDPKNVDQIATLSLGLYGAKVAVPKILEFLREEELKATFFTPGWTVDNHTGRVEAILKDGHELAHHGYMHRWPNIDKPDEIVEELDKGLDAMKRHFGYRPKGHRPPASETNHIVLTELKKRGFLYTSACKDDINPYRHVLRDGSPGPIEIPQQPTLGDWGYGATHIKSPRPLFPREHVLSIWQDDFEMLREWGGLVMLVLHPQVTGRPMRMKILREFIAFTRKHDKVWYATAAEIAEVFQAQEQAAARAAAE